MEQPKTEIVQVIQKQEMSTQTDTTLPHTMRNVTWSASCFESVLESQDYEDSAMGELPDEQPDDDCILCDQSTGG